MKNVLLLRAPDEDGPDRYEAAFEARGYVPLSVPVLETVFRVDALRDKIARGPASEGVSGVILTSKRAVEAWCESMPDMPADWRTVPFYVVGEATARAAERFASQVRGRETGTGERLAQFILDERVGGRMLYLTGDKNRETLPAMLAAGGVELDALEVYCTSASSTFRADLETALARAPVGRDWGWVVHFAPSAAGAVARVLDEVFGDEVKVAAIGPTTGSSLARVDATAPRPTPDALCTAVVAYDGTK